MAKTKWKRHRGVYGPKDEYYTVRRGYLVGTIYRTEEGWELTAHGLGPHTSLAKAKAAYERVKRASKEEK